MTKEKDLLKDSHSLEVAEEALAKLGLPMHAKPAETTDEVEWPENVAELSMDDLAHHMTWWSGWASFARYQLARSETNLAAFEAEYGWARNEFMFKSQGDYSKVTELKAAADARPDMKEKAARITQNKALVTVLRATLAGYESKYATCSRELTRRQSDHGEGDSRFKV